MPTLLVIDDEPQIRTLLKATLTRAGYAVVEAANGREALEYLQEAQTPEVILLDLMMPVMDGWEFRRRQQADPALARVPVIVLSALDPSRAAGVDAAAFLKKPLDFDHLLALVRTYCH